VAKIRRISIYSGPSCGKSTAAAWLFAELKKANCNIELVTEYVKTWTYIDRNPKSYEQYLIFGKQVYNEYLPLQAGFDYIITDSPVYLPCFYAKHNKEKFHKQLVELANVHDREFPSLNIFLERTENNTNFSEVGRFHNLEQSKKIDKQLKKFLVTHNVKYHPFNYDDLKGIKLFIECNLNKGYVDFRRTNEKL
tara:strand:+ start:6794 stop:7375 length:582 start_codon:yes stop_codon:yes gene_type:complete